MIAVESMGSLRVGTSANGRAPKIRDASISELDVRRKRATTLLNTTTMQNVACPTMIV